MPGTPKGLVGPRARHFLEITWFTWHRACKYARINTDCTTCPWLCCQSRAGRVEEMNLWGSVPLSVFSSVFPWVWVHLFLAQSWQCLLSPPVSGGRVTHGTCITVRGPINVMGHFREKWLLGQNPSYLCCPWWGKLESEGKGFKAGWVVWLCVHWLWRWSCHLSVRRPLPGAGRWVTGKPKSILGWSNIAARNRLPQGMSQMSPVSSSEGATSTFPAAPLSLNTLCKPRLCI